jgi:hypothetical protein
MDDRISSIDGSFGAGLFIDASQDLPEKTWLNATLTKVSELIRCSHISPDRHAFEPRASLRPQSSNENLRARGAKRQTKTPPLRNSDGVLM